MATGRSSHERFLLAQLEDIAEAGMTAAAMTLEQTLRQQLTAAMKAKDSQTANLIRMINTKIMERRTAKGFSGEVDDALHLEVIAAYQKQMKKAQEEFEAAGERGAERAAEARFEVQWCQQFLPQPLSEEELRAAVREAISETNTTDPKQAGRLVGVVMKKHKGRAEAADIKRLAEEELG